MYTKQTTCRRKRRSLVFGFLNVTERFLTGKQKKINECAFHSGLRRGTLVDHVAGTRSRRTVRTRVHERPRSVFVSCTADTGPRRACGGDRTRGRYRSAVRRRLRRVVPALWSRRNAPPPAGTADRVSRRARGGRVRLCWVEIYFARKARKCADTTTSTLPPAAPGTNRQLFEKRSGFVGPAGARFGSTSVTDQRGCRADDE